MTAAFAELDRAQKFAADKNRYRLRPWHVVLLVVGLALIPFVFAALFPPQ